MRNIFAACVFVASLLTVASAGVKPEDVIGKHLDSIGTADARAAAKSRTVQGTLKFKILVGGSGEFEGNWQMVSEQHKSNLMMKFNDVNWRGERLVFDGDKTSSASATASYRRSVFADFVNSYDFILRQGLLGGELSTNWGLQNIDRHRVKLEYDGVKKIDGRELQSVEYLAKGSDEMTVKLYFDPETGHHVMTTYNVIRGAGIAGNDVADARQSQIRYAIEERFSDFKAENGITLPRQYDLQFHQQLQDGKTSVYEWKMTADKVVENAPVDAASFQIK